jgi:hypothetical protein
MVGIAPTTNETGRAGLRLTRPAFSVSSETFQDLSADDYGRRLRITMGRRVTSFTVLVG